MRRRYKIIIALVVVALMNYGMIKYVDSSYQKNLARYNSLKSYNGFTSVSGSYVYVFPSGGTTYIRVDDLKAGKRIALGGVGGPMIEMSIDKFEDFSKLDGNTVYYFYDTGFGEITMYKIQSGILYSFDADNVLPFNYDWERATVVDGVPGVAVYPPTSVSFGDGIAWILIIFVSVLFIVWASIDPEEEIREKYSQPY